MFSSIDFCLIIWISSVARNFFFFYFRELSTTRTRFLSLVVSLLPYFSVASSLRTLRPLPTLAFGLHHQLISASRLLFVANKTSALTAQNSNTRYFSLRQIPSINIIYQALEIYPVSMFTTRHSSSITMFDSLSTHSYQMSDDASFGPKPRSSTSLLWSERIQKIQTILSQQDLVAITDNEILLDTLIATWDDHRSTIKSITSPRKETSLCVKRRKSSFPLRQ